MRRRSSCQFETEQDATHGRSITVGWWKASVKDRAVDPPNVAKPTAPKYREDGLVKSKNAGMGRIATLASVSLIAVACSSTAVSPSSASPSTAPPSTAPSASAAAVSPSPAKPESLTFWGSQETPQAVKDTIDAFGKQEGIKTEFVVLPADQGIVLTKIATGDKSDVIFWQSSVSGLLPLNPEKNLLDLSDMAVAGKLKYGMGELAGKVNGKVYAALFGFPTVFGVFYNKKVFADNGLTPPSTHQELLDVSAKLKAAGVPPMFLAEGDVWPNQLPVFEIRTDAIADGLIQKINNREATWTDPAIVDSFRIWKEYVDQGFLNPNYKTAKFTDSHTALLDGKTGMVAQGSWFTPGLVEAADGSSEKVDEAIGFFPWPSESGKLQWQASNLGSVQLFKTGDAAREAAARRFVDYITGDGYQGYLDSAKEAPILDGFQTPPLSKLTTDFVNAFETGSVPSEGMLQAVGTGDLPSWISQLQAGTLTPEQVAQNMQDAFEKNAKEAGIPGY